MYELKRGVYIDIETKEFYEVLGLTRNLETLEELVLFRPSKTSSIKDNVYFFVESLDNFSKQTDPKSKYFRLIYVQPLGLGE